jgi:hypothetical protein
MSALEKLRRKRLRAIANIFSIWWSRLNFNAEIADLGGAESWLKEVKWSDQACAAEQIECQARGLA